MNRSTLLSNLEGSIHTIVKGIREKQLSTSKYSLAQNHVIVVIGKEGDIGIKQLAQCLKVTSGAATQHVDALEKAGILSRQLNSDDRREVIVGLTDKGKKTFLKINQDKARILRELFNGLSDTELQILVSLFEKVSRKYIKE
jgi:DNA-binding MarR family transcriptional regulator